MHLHHDREVVKKGGDDGGDRHLDVRHAEELRHDEGARSHDRRHYLPASGGDGLDRAREVGLITYALHERDREHTRRADVGDR